jgi:hypothetical protein
MNDTETEARHLLAAATADMPPGIDLLDGFPAARRRDPARRTRKGAVLSAGIAAAAASVTAVTLTTGSAPPALATVTSALTRTLTQSYHLTQHVSTYYLWNGQVHLPGHDTCTSEADPVRHLEATSCSDLVNGGASREVGGYTYFYSVVPTRGRHWHRIPTACFSHQPPTINGFTAATPQQMLAEIKQAAKVTVAGPASGPGWTGRRYAFGGNAGTGTKLSGTVTVDQQGRARALILTIRSTSAANVFVMTQNLTFSDFGAPVTVTPPPADQTFSSPC